jgi:predicted outer membrane repeat protein
MNVATANVTITNSLIKDITSLYTSPAIYIYNDPSASASLFLSLTNSTFKNNSALQTGGAIESVNTNVTVSNCTFWNNYAS